MRQTLVNRRPVTKATYYPDGVFRLGRFKELIRLLALGFGSISSIRRVFVGLYLLL